jgi:hypothetical protein
MGTHKNERKNITTIHILTSQFMSKARNDPILVPGTETVHKHKFFTLK